MRFGLERMRRLLTVLGSPQERLRGDPRGRHQRQELDRAHGRGAAGGERRPHRRLPVAAPRQLRRARADRRRGRLRRRVRRGGRARRVGGREGGPDAQRRRAGDAVRAADRGRARRAGAPGRRGRGGRGGLGGRWDATNVLDAERRACSPTSGSSTRAGSGRRWPTSRARSSRWCERHATLVLGEADAEVEALARETGARIVRPRAARRAAARLPAHELPRGRRGRAARYGGRALHSRRRGRRARATCRAGSR